MKKVESDILTAGAAARDSDDMQHLDMKAVSAVKRVRERSLALYLYDLSDTV
jgi:hypothetical protein